MKITIKAFSSSGGSYPVEFLDEGGVMRVFCHCKAGIAQTMCKHKASLIRGDSKMLYDTSEEPLLRQVLGSKAYPELTARFDEYEKQLADVEREMAKLKEKERTIKSRFAYGLNFGKQKPNP